MKTCFFAAEVVESLYKPMEGFGHTKNHKTTREASLIETLKCNDIIFLKFSISFKEQCFLSHILTREKSVYSEMYVAFVHVNEL